MSKLVKKLIVEANVIIEETDKIQKDVLDAKSRLNAVNFDWGLMDDIVIYLHGMMKVEDANKELKRICDLLEDQTTPVDNDAISSKLN